MVKRSYEINTLKIERGATYTGRTSQKESVYLKVKITSEASSHHSG